MRRESGSKRNPKQNNAALINYDIKVISIFKEDNALSKQASLQYGPLVKTDINYQRTVYNYSDMRCWRCCIVERIYDRHLLFLFLTVNHSNKT